MDLPPSGQRIRSIAANDDPTLFPSLVEWRDNKLRDLSYCLATFFNYLAEPRNGFSPVDNKPEDVLAVRPVVTREMADFVLGEIFPCASMVKEGPFNTFRAPVELAKAIDRLIKKNISNRSLLAAPGNKKKPIQPTDLLIDPSVIQTIWTFVSNGIDALAYGLAEAATDEQVKQRLSKAEAATLGKRNCLKNYGFNDDAENCAFQTILYIIVACVDWLEYGTITRSEVVTAYKLIIPPDLQVILEPTNNPRMTEIITMAIVSKDLIPTEEAVNLISTMMIDVGKRIGSTDHASQRVMSALQFDYYNVYGIGRSRR